jgi:hypothetical protein
MLTADQIKERLDPLADDLVEGHLRGWEMWLQLMRERPDFTRPLERSERAALVHRHVCQEIDQRVSRRGYQMNRALTFSALAVGTDLLVRFKYMRDGQPWNVQTGQQRLLARQLYNDDMMDALALEGFTEPPTFVTAGYILDPREAEIAKVFILRECIGLDPQMIDLYPRRQVAAEPLVFPFIPDMRPARISSDEEIRIAEEPTKDDS